MGDDLVIPRRFCGPAGSGHGGWTCGALSRFVDGPAQVTLYRPPPLDTALTVTVEGPVAVLRDGPDVVADARPAQSELHWPPFVTPTEAAAASTRFLGYEHHEFPRCFACGTERDEDDGLRLFTGPVDGQPRLVATTWTPGPSLVEDTTLLAGTISDPVVWAALDCPSVWPHLSDGAVALLGRMSASVDRPVEVGRTYVVVGEGTDVDGRKRYGAAALFTEEGDRGAVANTTWITVERAPDGSRG